MEKRALGAAVVEELSLHATNGMKKSLLDPKLESLTLSAWD